MSDNEAFNKYPTDASTRVDFVAEANAKSAAALWLAYCEKKMELEDAQERIKKLEVALRHVIFNDQIDAYGPSGDVSLDIARAIYSEGEKKDGGN